MDIEVGVGHFDALLVEDVLHPLVDGEVYVPIVRRFGPEPQDIVDGVVSVAVHGSEGGGI